MANEEEIGSQRADQVDEGEEPAGREQKGPRSGEGKETSGWLRRVFAALPLWALRKPLLIVAAALLLGGAGAWGYFAIPAWKGAEPAKPPHPTEPTAGDGLRQEDLARFYIPLPKEVPFRVMVIEWSVVWDGLSAVRYRRTEVATRARVYDALTALAAKEARLNENLPVLEKAMGGTLRDSLRSESVSVRVKRVKTY